MKIKEINRKYILAIVILFSTFLLDYICKENNLVYRHWLSLSITYYRYAFLITIFIIIPCKFIIKKRNVWLVLLSLPVIILVICLFFVNMFINPVLGTIEYVTQKNGQEVIVLEETLFISKTYSYYTPVNIFFMTYSGIPDCKK